MKFSENWLRELVDVAATRAELTHRLTMCGLEVESTTPLEPALDGVVIARIVSAEQHPNADRLRVCQVDIGTAQTLQIVCGAPNARAGLIAPLATVGATLPGGLSIKAAQLRGVESFGMLCSAKELAIDADASGLMELPSDAPVGAALGQWLGLPDAIIELGLTPNRSDCLGLHGLAREVAAEFGTQTRLPDLKPASVTLSAQLPIAIDRGAGCPRYLGRIIEGLDAKAATPVWMRERLRRSGLRSISALVDVTNYVMLETGQPLHAFDADAVRGSVRVRRAAPGESLKLLDEREVVLDPEFLLIADDAGPLALAGVMGGYGSRVTDATTRVFLESAHFAPSAISGRARRLGMHTDASHRFERGVDPALPELAIERATELLLAIAGGAAGPISRAEHDDELPVRQPVALRRARIEKVLGIAVPDANVERILGTLGMQVANTSEGWHVTPPSARFDISIEEDLIEEVARIHGYDEIPIAAPRGELPVNPADESRLPLARLRERLVARGYHEALTFAFLSAASLDAWGIATPRITLANPLSADLAVMRTSLLPTLVAALKYSQDRQQSRVRLFELGRVYHDVAGAPVEEERIGFALAGAAAPEQWANAARPVDFYDLKADIEALANIRCEPGGPDFLHPGQCARVFVGQSEIGYIGTLHPRLAQALDVGAIVVGELSTVAVVARERPRSRELSKFPSVRRDLALIVKDEVSFDSIASAARGAAGSKLIDLKLMSVYRGAGVELGSKSVAIGLIFQDESRTLSEGEVEAAMATVIEATAATCGATVRS